MRFEQAKDGDVTCGSSATGMVRSICFPRLIYAHQFANYQLRLEIPRNDPKDALCSKFTYACGSWFSKGVCKLENLLLYYYDRMFTLCYMLHLLFTEQDVHDLKLHVTEQEIVHFKPKFTGWSIRPLADCQV